jgi:ABC-2 type transport system permease protein
MLLRQSTQLGVPLWQPVAGLLGVIAFTVVVVYAAARIFRVGLLMQGKTPKLTEIARWAFRG